MKNDDSILHLLTPPNTGTFYSPCPYANSQDAGQLKAELEGLLLPDGSHDKPDTRTDLACRDQ
jgi:hypothetical protein